NGAQGMVAMDYLSPVSTRVATFYGLNSVIHTDFNALTCAVQTTHGVQNDTITFERNDMFINAMKDFITLVQGNAVDARCPRLDTVRASAQLVADAWEKRQFTAYLDHPVS
ncbi:MAG: hypothetical protein AAF404_20665, partial [Pseudomonadota bacterium]